MRDGRVREGERCRSTRALRLDEGTFRISFSLARTI
jgi:hypothetical protein